MKHLITSQFGKEIMFIIIMNKIFRIVIILSIFLLTVGCKENADDVSLSKIEILFRELEKGEIKERLTPVYYGTNCRFGAMEEEIFYCSQCCRKTTYEFHLEGIVSYEKMNKYSDVLYSRNYQVRLKKLSEVGSSYGLSIDVDSTDFCSSCSRGEEKNHYLIVRYPEGKMVRTILREPEDMEKLKCFLEGKRVWYRLDGTARSLRNEIPLIKGLLGMGFYTRSKFPSLSLKKKMEKSEDDLLDLLGILRPRDNEE